MLTYCNGYAYLLAIASGWVKPSLFDHEVVKRMSVAGRISRIKVDGKGGGGSGGKAVVGVADGDGVGARRAYVDGLGALSIGPNIALKAAACVQRGGARAQSGWAADGWGGGRAETDRNGSTG